MDEDSIHRVRHGEIRSLEPSLSFMRADRELAIDEYRRWLLLEVSREYQRWLLQL
jgi:hypothetical protein